MPLKALIFDSFFDKHKGVVAFIRLFDGEIKPGQKVYFLATDSNATVMEVGVFKPTMEIISLLGAGEVGYMVTGLKDLDFVKVGDTISDSPNIENALPGYKEVEPKVYASIFTTMQEDYPKLKDSIYKLKLNDASLFFEVENIPALGFGYRCGFLGLLHLDIVRERLEREFDLDLIITTPSVEYKVLLRSGNGKNIDKNSKNLSAFEQFKLDLIDNLKLENIDKILGL